MALRIRIEHGQDAGKTLRLPDPGVYRAGRAPSTSFQVLDMKVSKEHLEIEHDPENGTTIRDLGSTHGTLLNGQKVAAVRPLSPGDEIRIGLTVLRVLSDGPGDADVKPVRPLDPAAQAEVAAPPVRENGSPGTAAAGSESTTSGATTSGGSTTGPKSTSSAPKTVGTPAARTLPPDALV